MAVLKQHTQKLISIKHFCKNSFPGVFFRVKSSVKLMQEIPSSIFQTAEFIPAECRILLKPQNSTEN